MTKKCDVTGRGPASGNNRSHSMRATRRKFNLNLIKIKLADGSTAQISSKIYKKMRGFVK